MDHTATKENQRQPRADHKLVRAVALASPTGELSAALTASIITTLLLAEDATVDVGNVRFELVAITHKESSDPFSVSVGDIELGSPALNFFHAATNGKKWWRFHHRIKILGEGTTYEQLRESLIGVCRRLRGQVGVPIGSLGLAFGAAARGGKPPPPPVTELVAKFSAEKERVTPARSASRSPVAKKVAPPASAKAASPKSASGKVPPSESPKKPAGKRKKASGPMPLNLGDPTDVSLLAENCRLAGMSPGLWVSGSDCVEMINLAIADLCQVEGEIPEDWTRSCRNRLSGADLLREHSDASAVFWQLVLDGEEETAFLMPAQPRADEGGEEAAPATEPDAEADAPEPPPEDDSAEPAAPEEPPKPDAPAEPAPEPTSSGNDRRAAEEEVAMLSREVAQLTSALASTSARLSQAVARLQG